MMHQDHEQFIRAEGFAAAARGAQGFAAPVLPITTRLRDIEAVLSRWTGYTALAVCAVLAASAII